MVEVGVGLRQCQLPLRTDGVTIAALQLLHSVGTTLHRLVKHDARIPKATGSMGNVQHITAVAPTGVTFHTVRHLD